MLERICLYMCALSQRAVNRDIFCLFHVFAVLQIDNVADAKEAAIALKQMGAKGVSGQETSLYLSLQRTKQKSK